MSVVVEPVKEVLHALIHHGVPGDGVGEAFQLLGGGQIAIEQQVGDFEEGALFRQLLDGVARISLKSISKVEIKVINNIERKRSTGDTDKKE